MRLKAQITGSKYFPYEPYPVQLEFMTDLDHLIRSNPGDNRVRIGLYEAPTGFGKTVTALSALLPFGRRIMYVTRTHSQTVQIANEVRQINQAKGLAIPCVVRASRRFLCLSPEIRACKSHEAVEKCLTGLRTVKQTTPRLTKYVSKTPEYDREYNNPDADEPRERKRLICEITGSKLDLPVEEPESCPLIGDVNTLIRFGKENHCCPYFLSKLLARRRAIVITPYNYLFRGDLPIWQNILVFDEAHNIEKVCKDACSLRINETSIEEAITELNIFGGFSALNLLELVEEFFTTFQRLDPGSSIQILKKRNLLELFTKHGLSEDFWYRLHNSMKDFESTNRGLATQQGTGFSPELLRSHSTITFLQTLITDPAEQFIGLLERAGKKGTQLSWICLDPARGFDLIHRKSPHAIILMSGTLSPMQSMIQLLDLSQPEIQNYSSIVKPSNVKVFALWRGAKGQLSTKFTKRNDPHLIYGVGKTVESIVKRVPNGSLVFFPSYSVLNRFLRVWRRFGILDTISQAATIFIEGDYPGKNVIADYKFKAVENRAVLFAVCRGTLSEGVDFPDATGRAALIVGVPYPDLSDLKIKIQQQYYDAKYAGVGKIWYLEEAIRVVNQTLGRVWRHQNDFALGYLLDSRYYAAPLRTRLSPWLRPFIKFPGPQVPFPTILSKLEQFYTQER